MIPIFNRVAYITIIVVFFFFFQTYIDLLFDSNLFDHFIIFEFLRKEIFLTLLMIIIYKYLLTNVTHLFNN